MDRRTTAVIPAFNEEKRIKKVLKPVIKSEVDEIIVVDDGSTDRTAEKIEEFEEIILKRKTENTGKADALTIGVRESKFENLLFLDADLVNLRKEHLNQILEEYFRGDQPKLVLGVFKDGRPLTDFAMSFSPRLTGQRALSKKLFEKAEERNSEGYGIEVAINQSAKKTGTEIVEVELEGVTQVMKEEKRGVFKGFLEKVLMYLQVYLTFLKNFFT